MSVLENKKKKGYYKIKGAISINGKKYYYNRESTKNKNFKSKKYCEKLELEIREEIINKNSNKVINITFETFFNSYKEYQCFKNFSDRTKEKLKTVEMHLKKVFCFNNSLEEELTIKKYEEFYEYIRNQDFSTKYKNRILFYVREMTNYAKNNHYGNADYLEDLIDILINFKSTINELNKNECRNKYTRLEDAKKVWESAEYPYNYVFELFYFSGCRISEFLAIKLSDIQLLEDESIIDINKQVDRKKGVINKNLKTVSSYRKIYFNKILTNTLKEYLKSCKFDDNDLIFNFSKSVFKNQLNKCFANAGGEYNTLHGFGRKSIATELFLVTKDAKVSQIHLGHKDLRGTLNDYIEYKPSNEEILSILNKITEEMN